jgi:hypothetical protein
MTLKIERISGKRGVRIRLSGELRFEHLDQVEAEIERAGPRVALDLEEVDLVDVESVRFLNACKAKGISLLQCSPYIKEWMFREQQLPMESSSGAQTERNTPMNELLDLAVRAHGGLDRWNRVNSIKVVASITGAIWFVKGKGDVLKNVVLTAETKTERLTVDFPGQDKRFIFEPSRVVTQRTDGTIIEARDNPVKSFEGQQTETPWDDVHVTYFAGEAMWTYLNVPFLYTRNGFATEEIASIQVEGEKWRRLKVTFPDDVKSHTREQISCFGPDGLLRRHDYTVDILGGAKGLNYASEYRNVDGIVFPTKRRVYAYEGDYQPVKDPVLVAIDMGQITLDRQWPVAMTSGAKSKEA